MDTLLVTGKGYVSIFYNIFCQMKVAGDSGRSKMLGMLPNVMGKFVLSLKRTDNSTVCPRANVQR